MRHLLLLEELHLSAGYLKSLRRDKKKKVENRNLCCFHVSNYDI